ncbi:dipeptidase [Opitutus sp. ER46]|uniref:dipeptidase n=1 Tax=Opitutus sp. ER46 TaxID=2161864 RepID=UPI000D316A25|nr:dipeptidase [Opitutus sp. ER46]PTX91844.1 dipeptidase [Opitutus sp. ER46]
MKTVLDYLKVNQPRFLEELGEFLRFPSISAQPEHRGDLLACAKWLTQHCASIGLTAKLCPTKGNPIVLARTPARSGRRPRVLIYGHYDVQPPDPLELWHSQPFEATRRGRNLFARGSADDKGQLFAHLKAVEAYLKTGTELPCDLIFVFEGEEEVGSESLTPFLRQMRKQLACDAVVVSDGDMPAKDMPALTYGLRGTVALEVTLRGPARDLHSGIFGGSVENPATALCRLLAQMHDAKGRITIPGFYDDVRPLSALERKELRRIFGSEEKYRRMLGVPKLHGEAGYSSIERTVARPTFEINGLTSGYQGPGGKTIVPAWSRAKLTLRIVPGQKPEKVLKSTIAYLKKLCPPTVRMEITDAHGSTPYLVEPTSTHAKAALRALQAGFGKKPVLTREGGSIPIVNDFKQVLGVDTLLLGIALPDANIHSPDERLDLDCFAAGQRMSAWLWQELAR